MLSLAYTLLVLNLSVAHALPKHHHRCGRPPVNSTVSVGLPASSVLTEATFSSLLSSTVIETSASTPTTVSSEATTATASTVKSAVVDVTSTPESAAKTSSVATIVKTVVAASSTSHTSPDTAIVSAYAQATALLNSPPASEHCGDEDRLILPGQPWTVSNAMYNADQMVGTQCTNFENILQTSEGVKEVQWSSVTNIELVDSTKDLCKGYTNIGIGVNLKKQFKDITSIPAYFQWERTNTTAFRGANVFDFIMAPTAGDSSSTASSEFMLWLQIWGNQVPIAYAEGPVATIDNLFGASWHLYEGTNPASGVTVRSMLLVEDGTFNGAFQGDLKDWLQVMMEKGYVADTDYVNEGNAGSEVFYGSAVMNAKVALNINV